MSKKIIAREWLYFLGLVLMGLVCPPIFFSAVGAIKMTEFYGILFGCGSNDEAFFAWFWVLFPYLLFQFIRSIILAWKIIRNPN